MRTPSTRYIITSFFLVALISNVVLSPLVSAASTPFVDVSADYDFREAIGFLKDQKIVQGYPDQTYKPDASVSRAEFLKIAMKLSGRKVDLTGVKELFNDVHKDDWFFGDVMTAQRLGIIQGTGAGNTAAFLPNGKITRVQALKIAFNALQFSAPAAKITDPAPADVSSKAWYFSQAMMARRLNILTDSDDGNFYPDQEVTRGMAAEILFRVHTVKQQGYTAYDITKNWIDVEQVISGGEGLGGITFKVPKNWIAVKDGSRITVIKKDPKFPLDMELVTPMSAKVTVKTTVSETTESSGVYFEQIKAMSRQAYPNDEVSFTPVTLMGQPALHVKVASKGVENWYIYMPNKTIATVYSQYGLSSLSLKMRESIRGLVRTLHVNGTQSTDSGTMSAANQKLLSDIQKQVLVEKTGKATVDTLSDAVIVETDDIGVGTGPVDYYYSAKINLTLKYERASDTILSVRSGKTTQF